MFEFPKELVVMVNPSWPGDEKFRVTTDLEKPGVKVVPKEMLDVALKTEVTIGQYTLEQKGYGDQFWIYNKSREGAALGEKSLKKLEALLDKFYSEVF